MFSSSRPRTDIFDAMKFACSSRLLQSGCARRQWSCLPSIALSHGAGKTVVAGEKSLVELGQRLHQPVPRSECHTLERTESESHLAPLFSSAGRDRSVPQNSCSIAESTTHIAASREYLQALPARWGAANAGASRPRPVAYFSATPNCTDPFPSDSGGLGVLS